MCGIAGLLGATAAPGTVECMLGEIGHRGPDATGTWMSPNAALGHVRLSIIDVSAAANQPFEKDGLVLCYNGEIYNYRELRDELAARGVAFRTQSDTEVLLEAWRAWGPACLPRLRGMFAFAITDVASGTGWIARDRFGIKPLFYHPLPGGGLAFASELKAIEAAYRSNLTLDTASVGASLLYVYLPEDRCIWREVRKLRPGEFLTIHPGGHLEHDRFWYPGELLFAESERYRDEASAVRGLSEALQQSVRAHLVADVPVGSFLSGGLDSSLLTAMAARETGNLDCHTIRFPSAALSHEGMTDDAPYAERVAADLGLKLSVVDLEPDVVGLIPAITRHLDEPIGDSAAINTYLMSKAARDAGTKVLLSGAGADELFGGYRRHIAVLLARRYAWVPGGFRDVARSLANALPTSLGGQGLVPVRWARRFLQFAGLPEADAYQRSYNYYGREDFADLLTGEGAAVFAALRQSHLDTYWAGGGDTVERMLLTDVQDFLVSLNLTYTDRASMAASVEVRVPFVDPVVAETAFRIPSVMKIADGRGKHILKRVAADWLPSYVIERPKSSFTMPLRAWVRNELGDMIDDYVLSQRGLAGRGMLSPEALRRIVADERAGRADNAQRIWQLLTLEQWFRNHGI